VGKHERQLLGELFERAARRAGYPGLWCAYVSGRLGLEELAARHDVDRAALWWVVVEGRHATATGARGRPIGQPPSQARPIRRACRADERTVDEPARSEDDGWPALG
jgi:hypothetical protein